MKQISLYIHYPFCASKCPYCDFNSYCNIKINENDLINAYIKELNYYSKYATNAMVYTIYFGGGTPSLMTEKLLSSILNKIYDLYNVFKNCEITLEANPNSMNFDKMINFKNIGINRLSIGVQSLYDNELKYLGRLHDRNEALVAIKNAQKIFHDRYSIDLIHTRPNQNIKDWKNELNEVIKLSPFHISLYQLIIEKGTIFYKNKIKLPNDDISIDFYNLTRDLLEENDINFYEISNYAKKGYESKHNMVYWTNGEWLGIGAGAHTRINYNEKRYAIQNVKNPLKWLEKINQNNNSISIKNVLFNREIMEEFILMGLRIKNGINIKNLQKNINIDNFYEVLNEKNINFLVTNDLIEANKFNINIKKDSFILLNSIIEKIEIL